VARCGQLGGFVSWRCYKIHHIGRLNWGVSLSGLSKTRNSVCCGCRPSHIVHSSRYRIPYSVDLVVFIYSFSQVPHCTPWYSMVPRLDQNIPNSTVSLVKALPECDFALRYDGEAHGFMDGIRDGILWQSCDISACFREP
jgi:hypothetical protein